MPYYQLLGYRRRNDDDSICPLAQETVSFGESFTREDYEGRVLRVPLFRRHFTDATINQK